MIHGNRNIYLEIGKHIEKIIGVVIPAYNEERLIGQVIETIPDYVDHIIVEDDCSDDKTIDIVNNYFPEIENRLYLIQHPTNQRGGGVIGNDYKWYWD